MEKINNKRQHNPFVIPFVIILIFGVVEFFGGVWTNSLALLGDAWHMFSDAIALGLAMLAAYHVAKKSATNQTSRVELVASICNAVLMAAMIVWIVIEAIERISQPRAVAGGYVMLIAFVGLLINIVVAKQLHQHEGEKGINHQAALLHVLGDLLGSVAALVAGLVIYLTGWLLIDPILSILIAMLLTLATFNLIKNIKLTVSGKLAQRHEGHRH